MDEQPNKITLKPTIISSYYVTTALLLLSKLLNREVGIFKFKGK